MDHHDRPQSPDAPGHDASAVNPWSTVASKLIYDNPWIRLREDQVIRPDGKPGIYGVVHFKNKAVGVLPVDSDGSVWLVGQYRYALDCYSWEIPEGGCPADETPEACARRELLEETGLTARRLEPIVTTHLSNSVTDEWGVIYRATELTRGASQPDGCERLRVRQLPFEEALALVERGVITDSLSVMALLHEGMRRRGESPVSSLAHTLALRIFDESLAIVRLEAGADLPAWASGGGIVSVTRTASELSIVAPAARVPGDTNASRGWVAFAIEGVLDLSETGVLASVASALAGACVPLFAVSTFETDYVLVRESDRERARDALVARGHIVRD